MQITISGHHIELTDAIRHHVEEKLELLNKFNTHITKIEVILSLEGARHIAKATVHMPPKKELHAEALSDDLYASIDLLEKKLEKQIKDESDKLHDHKAKTSTKETFL